MASPMDESLDMKDYVRECIKEEFMFIRPIDILLALLPSFEFSDIESSEILMSKMHDGDVACSKKLMETILSKSFENDPSNVRWFNTLEDVITLFGERHIITILRKDKTSESYKKSISFFNLFRQIMCIDSVINVHQLALELKRMEEPGIKFLDDEIYSYMNHNRPGGRAVKLAVFLQQIQMKVNFNWIPYFFFALKNLKHNDLLKTVDPLLCQGDSLYKMKDIYSAIVQKQFQAISQEDEDRITSYKNINEDEPIAIYHSVQGDNENMLQDVPPKRICSENLGNNSTKALNADQLAKKYEINTPTVMEIDKSDNDTLIKMNLNIMNDNRSEFTETTDSNVTVKLAAKEEIVERQDLVLREYQKEYAKPALEGLNTLIVAPTGCGKTHIAMHIVKEHLDQDSLEHTVVVVVPTVTLVDQLLREFKKFLYEYSDSIASFHGSMTDSLSIKNSLDNKILILTPQLLLNNLTLGDDKLVLHDQFSLIIFDECHHTLKNHPYAQVMGIYHEEKEMNGNKHRTQIVGLTASPSVQRARNFNEAKDAIIDLCSHLDIKKVPIIKENVDEFKRFINTVEEEIIEVPPINRDSFANEIKNLMKGIEQLWNDKKSSSMDGQFQRAFATIGQFPSEKGSEIYTTWISQTQSHIAQIRDVNIREFFYSAKIMLYDYNNGLILYNDLNAKECLTYLKQKFQPEIQKKRSENQQLWFQDFKDCLPELEEMANDPNNINPKLVELKKILRDKCQRGIIFAKTRVTIDFLVKWINEDKQLSYLNASNLVGSGASDLGMSNKQQRDVLSYFKSGFHKVLVSSSIGEEGLDISNCDLVVTYEHVSEMKSMIQRRGRGRAENSRYILITSTSNQNYHKEKINMVREDFLKECLQNLATEEGEFELLFKIPKVQKRMSIDRKLKRLRPDARNQANDKIFEFRCMKCDSFACMSSDFRLLGNSHRIILLRGFEQKYIVKEHPNKHCKRGNIERVGKIHCAICEENWGVLIKHEGLVLPILTINPFILIDTSDLSFKRKHHKNWKTAQIHSPDLKSEELQILKEIYDN